jgi:hypothetical protein
MTTTGPDQRFEPSAGADELLLVPITLELAPIRQLLVIDVADDPTYRTLEPQSLDGPDGGGLVLLAYRHDGYVEVYAEPHLQVDASGYEGLGKGLAGIHPTAFRPARYEVGDHGLELDLAFHASNGRQVELHLHEHLTGPRDRVPVLAPVGGGFDTPAFLPFVWLPGLSFVPAHGTEVLLRVDGEPRTIRRLPVPIDGRRRLMARYDPDVMVCQLNPDWVTDIPRVPALPRGTQRRDGVEVVDRDGRPAIAGVRVTRGHHTCSVQLDPPLPDLACLPPAAHRSGAVAVRADHTTELRARYELRRSGDRIDLVIDELEPWRTRQRRLPLAVLFRLPIFRRWPTTYRWQATLDLSDAAGQRSRWSSRWSRDTGR